MTKQVAIVTGVSGQDGSLMVDYLLDKTDLIVVGIGPKVKPKDNVMPECVFKHLSNPRFINLWMDVADASLIAQIIGYFKPDYFLNFAAQTSIPLSKEKPEETMNVNAFAVKHMLSALQKLNKPVRFFNAGSSEELAPAEYAPQDEKHPRRFNNPYGISKVLAHHLVEDYRELGMFAIQPYLYNHLSERMSRTFLPRKVSQYLGFMRYTWKETDPYTGPILKVGNLDAKRDWTSAREVIEAIWLSLNAETPRDYIIASGKTTSVRELIDDAFIYSGQDIDADWIDNKLVTRKHGSVLVESTPEFVRDEDTIQLVGNPSLIKKELGWQACKSVQEVMYDMVLEDLKYVLDRCTKRK